MFKNDRKIKAFKRKRQKKALSLSKTMKMVRFREFILLLLTLIVQQSRFSSIELTLSGHYSKNDSLDFKSEHAEGEVFVADFV
jgi:hypothetical protein